MANLLTNPENLAGWSVVGTTSVNSNVATAPDGTATADRIVDDNSGGTGNVFIRQVPIVLNNTAYHYAMFFQAEGLDWVTMRFTSHGSKNIFQSFNLAAVAVGTPGSDVDSSAIENYGGGYYRCRLSFTSDAVDTNGQAQIFLC